MSDKPTVNGPTTPKPTRTIGTRYPEDRIKLLEAVQSRRGDPTLSATVAYAIDQLIEHHLPGAIEED